MTYKPVILLLILFLLGFTLIGQRMQHDSTRWQMGITAATSPFTKSPPVYAGIYSQFKLNPKLQLSTGLFINKIQGLDYTASSFTVIFGQSIDTIEETLKINTTLNAGISAGIGYTPMNGLTVTAGFFCSRLLYTGGTYTRHHISEWNNFAPVDYTIQGWNKGLRKSDAGFMLTASQQIARRISIGLIWYNGLTDITRNTYYNSVQKQYNRLFLISAGYTFFKHK